MTDIDNTTVSAQQQIADLQRQNELLRERLDRLERLTLGSAHDSATTSTPADLPDPESTPTSIDTRPNWSRRALLLGGVGAAAAAAAQVSGASPAAAAAGEPVLQGRINNAGNTVTTLLGTAGSSLVVVNSSAGSAILATANSGDAVVATSPSGNGVAGTSQSGNGVAGTSRSVGVLGEASDPDDSVGVRGLSPDTGVYGEGGKSGVAGAGIREGGFFFSPQGAVVHLAPGDRVKVPGGGTWRPGDLVSTSTGEIWLCTGVGVGDWRLLGSPASSGAYVPLTPARVYDSRKALPDGDSILVGGSSRVIDVGFARNPDTGAVISRVVPLETRAIAANITITGTTRSGYVALTPGNAPNFTGSSINWSAPQTTLANGLVLTTDALVKLKAWTVGGNTHLIIDVVGYYAQA
jgi:hypothetical protein